MHEYISITFLNSRGFAYVARGQRKLFKSHFFWPRDVGSSVLPVFRAQSACREAHTTAPARLFYCSGAENFAPRCIRGSKRERRFLGDFSGKIVGRKGFGWKWNVSMCRRRFFYFKYV